MKPSNQDIFEFNMSYKNDIAFSEMRTISKYILYSITYNFNIYTNFIRRQNINFSDSAIFNNGGDFFNMIQLSESIKPYTETEFNEICSTFTNTISQSRKFQFITNRLSSPVKCFIYFTKYFYIPVRLDITSIPESKLIEYATNWLTTISILIQLETYSSKFITTIDHLDIYYMCFKQVFTNEYVLSNFKSQTTDKIDSYLSRAIDIKHKVSLFYIIMLKLIYNISLEVIHKFCPNYKLVKSINPNYDGIWISPLDTDVNDQYNQIRACFSLLSK